MMRITFFLFLAALGTSKLVHATSYDCQFGTGTSFEYGPHVTVPSPLPSGTTLLGTVLLGNYSATIAIDNSTARSSDAVLLTTVYDEKKNVLTSSKTDPSVQNKWTHLQYYPLDLNLSCYGPNYQDPSFHWPAEPIKYDCSLQVGADRLTKRFELPRFVDSSVHPHDLGSIKTGDYSATLSWYFREGQPGPLLRVYLLTNSGQDHSSYIDLDGTQQTKGFLLEGPNSEARLVCTSL